MNKKVASLIVGATMLGGGTLAVDAQINPYDTVTKVENGKTVQTLEIAKESTLTEAGEVKDVVSTDEPKITLQKWNGEVALGIKSMDLPSDTTGSRPFLSKNVEWSSGNVKMEAVPLDASPTVGEDGGMEINIILNSEPTSNVFTFQLDNWENLDFFYQAPLTKEDITEKVSIPINVVGSYAVYNKDKTNHIEGKINYATGKAYQIYRPLVTDNSGQTTWADLSYSNGILSVTVPQSFLDSAIYPVKIDPTFGYTSIGASTLDTIGEGRISNFGAAPASGQVTNLSLYIQTVAAFNCNYNIVLYDNSGTNVLKDYTAKTLINNTTPAWYTLASIVGFNLVSGTTYWLGEWCDSCSSATQIRIYFDAGTSDFCSGVYSDPPPNCTRSGSSSRKFSVYATYTASGGATTYSSTKIINQSKEIIKNSTVIIP